MVWWVEMVVIVSKNSWCWLYEVVLLECCSVYGSVWLCLG